ncbi:MAG: helix-turn-helix domain-containing protein [Nitrospirae bacterium]|nr:helix-turn-helix domain-containing protein [Nitrospirota bacterium]
MEEISAITRIKPSYLKALEEENFRALPGEVYTRGYIRAYIESMSMDSSEALRIFQAEGQNNGHNGNNPLKGHNGNNKGNSERISPDTLELIAKPYTFTPLWKRNEKKSAATRQLVYLLILVSFLAVAVYTPKLFSFTKETKASVNHPVGNAVKTPQKDIPGSGNAQPTQQKPAAVVEKAAVSDSPGLPNSKEPAPKPSGKSNESMNFMKMSTAEASVPNQPQASVQSAELPELGDISKVIKKMETVAASLKSIKTTIEKVKAAQQKKTFFVSKKSSNPANMLTINAATEEKPDTRLSAQKMSSALPVNEKEINKSSVDVFVSYNYSGIAKSADDGLISSNIQPENTREHTSEKCQSSEGVDVSKGGLSESLEIFGYTPKGELCSTTGSKLNLEDPLSNEGSHALPVI